MQRTHHLASHSESSFTAGEVDNARTTRAWCVLVAGGGLRCVACLALVVSFGKLCNAATCCESRANERRAANAMVAVAMCDPGHYSRSLRRWGIPPRLQPLASTCACVRVLCVCVCGLQGLYVDLKSFWTKTLNAIIKSAGVGGCTVQNTARILGNALGLLAAKQPSRVV